MIKLLPKIDGVVDRFDRPFLRKRKFTGLFNRWPPIWTTLVFQPLFEATPEYSTLYESEALACSLFGINFVGRPELVEGQVGKNTDICVNGAFDDNSIWDYGSVPLWSWQAPGKARFESSALYSYDTMSQTITSVQAGRTYMVVYTILSISAGADITPGIGGVDGAQQTTPGTKTDIITTTGSGDLEFYADSLNPGDYVEIDDVYVYDLTTLDLVGTPRVSPLYDSEVERM